MTTHFKEYLFPLVLLCSILLGAVTGYYFGQDALRLKPLGDIFLHLMVTAVVPLVFFSVSSAIARIGSGERFGKLLISMLVVFLFTGLVAACYMLAIVMIFPPAEGVIPIPLAGATMALQAGDQLANMFTVADFSQLFTHTHMLALIVFAILVGLATTSAGERGKPFLHCMQAGEAVFMKVFTYIMYYAPIGFFAYFAVLVAELGPKIMQSYLHVTVVYYVAAIIYFVVIFTAYAYLANKTQGIKLFWKNLFLPSVTALATCSSAASIPVNIAATKNMQVPTDIAETVVPVGSIIHKDGSVLGGMVKIAFLFGLFHMSFSGPSVILTALAVAVLVGTVMGAIPSGGMVGEMLILSVYGFPPAALMVIAAISIIIDPIATLLNVTCNSVGSMMVARIMHYKPYQGQTPLVR